MAQDETGWLIERHSSNGSTCMDYLYVGSWDGLCPDSVQFTSDSMLALRFCRREDAERIAHLIENEDIYIVEHMWCAPYDPNNTGSNSESLLALQDYMNTRHLIGEMEAHGDCCSCDPDNFHKCEYCSDMSERESELRRLQDIWADRWIVMLAVSNHVQAVSG